MLLDPVPGGKFLAVTGSDLDPIVIGTYVCPRGTKVTMIQEKAYSKTPVPGKAGTVKEVLGFADWNISIEFEYVGNTGLASEALAEWRQIFSEWSEETEVSIVNSKINAAGVMFVLLTRIELPDNDRGFELPVRIEAVSDDGPLFSLESPL